MNSTMLAIVFPNIEPVALKIGNIEIFWYGIFYLIAIFSCLYIAIKLDKTNSILKKDSIDNFLTYIVLGIIIGGRVGYITIYHPDWIIHSFDRIFKIWKGGMSFHGGVMGVTVANFLFCKKNNIKFFKLMDMIACVAPIGIFFGRMGNFVNAELYGRPTSMVWGMIFPYTDLLPRHPSQLYEAFTEGILLFLIMLYLFYRTNSRTHYGRLSGLFLIFYSVFRVINEFFREPDHHIGFILFNNITIGQLVSFPFILLGIYLVVRRDKIS